MKIGHDIAAADEFSPNVELRNGRPVGVVFDALANRWVREDIDVRECDLLLLQDPYDAVGETALGPLFRPFHEQDYIVGFYRFVDFIQDISAHQASFSAAAGVSVLS